MKLFNRKIKVLEEKIEQLEEERWNFLEKENSILMSLAACNSTIESLREENLALKQENVELLDKLRKILKEAVQ